LLSVAAAVAQAGCYDLVMNAKSERAIDGCAVQNYCSYEATISCPQSDELLDKCGGTTDAVHFNVGCFGFNTIIFGSGGGGGGGPFIDSDAE